jgi:hypothetical protein
MGERLSPGTAADTLAREATQRHVEVPVGVVRGDGLLPWLSGPADYWYAQGFETVAQRLPL